MQNGELLRAAETEGLEAVITTDQNLRYPQNLPTRRLAVLVLLTTDWRLLRQHSNYVARTVSTLAAGDFVELPFPPR